ncbi:Copper transport protein-like protein [Hapsidospora chrysogenum ATCC 11550]|uniref:Copper transport protein n=1 Tax=Hapsidospora chrysogenum (strain ATCC 11550 / CBS 779.69 / DSM 880 / IAM 14645 / JCM 23072 / IMI 49137) TaxID=857340 RepID=A0A086TFC7_HAPC1|nr:Copper transport protein-like protein [Hapsidospora chrysogenum ATCC 11550]
MDHGHMDHGDMDHGDGAMDDMCSMNMLFTWDTTNLCIVFRSWHVRSTASLIFSLAAVVLLAVGYEAMRALSRRYETAVAHRIDSVPNAVTETTPFFTSGQNQTPAAQRAHLIKGLLYALQTFYAFMLMLVFMTYNGWVMLAVSIGAFVGYVLFGQATPATRDNACH